MFSSDFCLAVISMTWTFIFIKEFKPIYIFKQFYLFPMIIPTVQNLGRVKMKYYSKTYQRSNFTFCHNPNSTTTQPQLNFKNAFAKPQHHPIHRTWQKPPGITRWTFIDHSWIAMRQQGAISRENRRKLFRVSEVENFVLSIWPLLPQTSSPDIFMHCAVSKLVVK